MTFLPIVERELRVAARQRTTWWYRIGAALVSLLIGGWIMLIPGFNRPQQLGEALFVSLAIFTYIYCALAGMRTTADCLSEEKRDGTLGLLFLTDLRGYDIVLGKLFATSLNAFYGALAVFPVMAIPLLLGGVTIAEFGRVVLSSLNALFFSLTVGMFCSALCQDERKSIFTTLLLLLLFIAGFPVAGLLVGHWFDLRSFPPFFLIPSPGYTCFMAFEETFVGLRKVNFYYSSLLTVHLMSWGFLVSACLIVPRSWHDQVLGASRSRIGRAMHELKHGQRRSRDTFRQRLLDLNPIYWLTSRDRLKPLTSWLLLAAGGLVWMWGVAKYPRDWLHEVPYVMTALACHSILKLLLVTEACRQFAHDRKSGAFELLLATPLPVKQLVHGQLASLSRQFLGPVLVVLAVDVLFMSTERHDREWVLTWMAGMTVFIVDMVVLGWLGMWLGLKSGNTSRATFGAVLLNLVSPWLAFAFLMTAVSFSPGSWTSVRRIFGSEDIFILACWTGISLTFAVVLGRWARQGLLVRFREIAAEKYKGGREKLSSSPVLPAPLVK